MTLKSEADLQHMRAAGRMVAEILLELASAVRPGVTTAALNGVAEKEIKKRRVTSAFKGYRPYPNMPPYPASLCSSANDEVVHGVPSPKRVLKEGDIISLDFAILHNGFAADAAITLPVGDISKAVRRLLAVAQQSLMEGIFQAKPGRRLSDLGHAIQSYAEGHGYGVVREYVGHGIGRKMHEPPAVPNYGEAGTGLRLLPGMTLAIEPMINQGTHETEVLDDGWTVRTADGKLSAHFEHTVAITEDGPEILTKL